MNKADSEIITQVSFNSSDPEDPFPTVLPMIGTMGSFAYPSADLNDPLYVPLARFFTYWQHIVCHRTDSLRLRGF